MHMHHNIVIMDCRSTSTLHMHIQIPHEFEVDIEVGIHAKIENILIINDKQSSKEQQDRKGKY